MHSQSKNVINKVNHTSISVDPSQLEPPHRQQRSRNPSGSDSVQSERGVGQPVARIEEISDKDKMIALLQSKLLEMNRKEVKLESEIDRLKQKLKERKDSQSDLEPSDDCV